MARAPAGLPAGIRLSDHISLGVIARTFPIEEVQQVLAETGKASERERDLPAHVMVYYAIALALYMPLWHPRGAALPPGGPALAVGCGRGQGGGQERHLAGPHAPGRGAAVPAPRSAGAPGRDARHARCLVPAMAPGQPGRLLPGRRRHRGEPRRLRAPRRQPRRERLPAGPLRRPGRERHACPVRHPAGPLRGGRDHARPGGSRGAALGHAVPGRPAVLRPRALAGSRRQRRRPALAGEAQPAAAARGAAGRRLLPDLDLPQREGSAAQGGRASRCGWSSTGSTGSPTPSRCTGW